MKRLHEGDHCFVCGVYGDDFNPLETHHCMNGANRKNAEKYGLTVKVCRFCHMNIHEHDQELQDNLRKMAQVAFEYKHSHEEWMKIFGRSYI